MARRFSLALLTLALAVTSGSIPGADSAGQTLPFSQGWSNTGLITVDDDWAGVPGIVGYRGDNLTAATGTDPQTILAPGLETTDSPAGVVDVNANRSDPNTFATGGVTEFDGVADPVAALTGSGTADAPFIVIHATTIGQENVNVSYLLRDLDASIDNAVQQVALQYRIGSSGNFTNLPAGYVADATTGPSLAALVTPISVTLPPAADNQPVVQVRIITTNAVGNDEWVGIDDISITGSAMPSTPPSGVGAAAPASLLAGTTTLLTVSATPGSNPTSAGLGVFADLSVIGGLTIQPFSDTGTDGDLSAGDDIFSFSATVAPGTAPGGKTLPFTVTDAQTRSGTGSIALTIDPPPPPPPPSGVPLPLLQDWTDLGLITVNDDWSGVTGIVGYRGDDLISATGTDPQTVLADGSGTPVDVNANQTNPDTFATGGVTEFHLTNPTVALTGSETADAPFLRMAVSTAGVTNVRVSYIVRDLDGSADNAVQPVALQYRVGNTGPFTNLPAAFIADATTGPSQALLVMPVSVVLPADAGNQPRVEIRVITTNAVGNDEWVGIDDIAIVDADAPIPPTGSGAANPSSLPAGASTLLTVAVTPGSNPPSTGLGVTADLAPIGTFGLQAFFDNGTNGDVSADDGIFSLSATVPANVPAGLKLVPFTVSDAQFRSSQGSISLTVLPPPPPLVFIHDIQGSGSMSGMVGQQVYTQGIVTAVTFNSFFLQEEASDYDADPNTSEGILVFTGSPVPSGALVGNLVSVLGTVAEFIPNTDSFSAPKTELLNITVTVDGTGLPLPAPVTLTAADMDPSGGLDVLERFEGMRVQVNSLAVVAPTLGNINESNATATSSGVFYGVITGLSRPFREPGIQVPDPLPVGAPQTIPRFDGNPERLRVDSDAQTGALPIDVAAADTVTNLVGPLDYGFRTYTILLDPGTASAVHTTTVTPVTVPDASQFTVASANLQRLFDTVNDPGIGEPVLTADAFDDRLNKAALLIRDVLRSPDILGVEEVENLAVLQAVAARVNADAVTAGQPDPAYVAYLEEGNDVGGIDSGFLVKSARVAVVDVVQEGQATTYINPNNSQPELLNDRPPLLLRAVVNHGGQQAAVTVIVNHLRSLSAVDDPTDGHRVRTKRRAQAEFLANLVQARQVADPSERIILVGDFNAFQFNDGFGDSIGTIKGTPVPADQVVLASPDLVTPDLVNLVETEAPEQRYSFSFDGNAQTLDHVLVTQNVMDLFDRFEHARVNADFPEVARNDTTVPTRFSDHDPVVAFFRFPSPTVTAVDASINPSIFGQSVTFTATVTSGGVPVTQGSVTFKDGDSQLSSGFLDGNGQAVFTAGSLSAGMHTIVAQYAGAGAFDPSDGLVTQVVNPAGTSTTIVSSFNPSGFGQAVTFTATVTSAGVPMTEGSVTFKDGDAALSPPVILDGNGQAGFTTGALARGDHVITAQYSSPGNFSSSQDSVTQTVRAGVSIADVSVSEGNVPGTVAATFQVTLSTPSTQTVTVNYTTANGTAIAGSDYAAKSGVLTFAPGVTTQTIGVVILSDTLNEADETFFANLTGAVNAVVTDAQGVGTITNNDPPPGVTISDDTIFETNTGTSNIVFAVRLSAVSGRAVTVDYTTADGTATAPSDYLSANGTLTFNPGETTKTIPVTVVNDTVREGSENLLVNLSNLTNANVIDSLGIGTIQDNDPIPQLRIGDVTVSEPDGGSVDAVFTVTLSAPSGQTVRVTYSTQNGTALAGSDYTASSGTLTFAPGEASKAITVAVLADSLNETVQTFLVRLATPVNAVFADATGIGTIFDAARPQITSFTPSSGAPGTIVTITGVNFSAITSVRFNNILAVFKVDNPTTITATVPATATSGVISVSNAQGTATSASVFTVTPGVS